jgi:hypothetical protein
MATAFEKTVTGITAGSGGKLAVEVQVPYAGVINRVVVNQSAGTKSGYTLEIYNKLSYAGSTISALGYGTDTTPGNQSIIGKVIPTLNVGTGVDFEEVFDISYPYRNKDTKSRGLENNVLHIVINPTTANSDEVFELTIAGVVSTAY